MSLLPEIERELLRAARSLPPEPEPIGAERQRPRRRGLTVAGMLSASLAVVGVIVVAGGAILTPAIYNHGQQAANTAAHHHPHPPIRQLPPSVAALAKHFAVFRDPTVKLPHQVLQAFGSLGSGLERGEAHRVTRPAGTVWIAPESAGPCIAFTEPGTQQPAGAPCGDESGGLCIAFTKPRTHEPGGATCGDIAEAERAEIRMSGWRPGLGLAAGVVPDGISAAQVNLAAGTTITARVEHNVYAATAHSQITSVHLIPTNRAHSKPAGPQVTAGCPLSHAGGPRPPKIALQNFGTPMGRPSDPGWFGNGVLWTQLPAPTQTRRDPKTGMIAMKFAWFRARPGNLVVQARRLSPGNSRFTADVGTSAEYGRTGFDISGLSFGAPGCWQLLAKLDGRRLHVTIFVHARAR